MFIGEPPPDGITPPDSFSIQKTPPPTGAAPPTFFKSPPVETASSRKNNNGITRIRNSRHRCSIGVGMGGRGSLLIAQIRLRPSCSSRATLRSPAAAQSTDLPRGWNHAGVADRQGPSLHTPRVNAGSQDAP